MQASSSNFLSSKTARRGHIGVIASAWVAWYINGWVFDTTVFLVVYSLLRARVRGKRTRLPRVWLIFFSKRWLQNLLAINTSLLIFLNSAGCPQGIHHERPCMLPRPQIGWFEVMLGDNSQSRYWKEHFRMGVRTFPWLLALVAPEISRRNTRLWKAIPRPKRVAIALWRLAGGGSFGDVATHFDVGKSTCVKISREVCYALNRLSKHFIKFPVTCRETTKTITLFQDE